MFKKIVEFFTGKKSESKFAHPLDAVTTPTVPQAPYKVPEPIVETPVVAVPVVETPVTVEKTVVAPAQPEKKPAVAKATRKPRTPKQ
jgi:hypothetical protein